jgi:hypothetical protein
MHCLLYVNHNANTFLSNATCNSQAQGSFYKRPDCRYSKGANQQTVRTHRGQPTGQTS